MQDTAADYFGSMVQEFDSLMRRAVPVYDEMLERIVTYSPPSDVRVTSILELGCGTGNLTSALAARHPGASITLVDASPEMLEAARQRLAPRRQVTTIAATFEELELEPHSFDLVTSCMAVHHVVDLTALFRKLQRALVPGGRLIYADQMRGTTAEHHAINWGRLVEFWQRPGNLTELEMHELEEHAQLHDHYVTVPEQLAMLDAVGFGELDCVWRSWMWGLITAEVPAR